MPRSKLSVAIETTKLASREELDGMGRTALIVQREKREKILPQLVGNLYPGIVTDEIWTINELLRKAK
jgi:hypothetical protein